MTEYEIRPHLGTHQIFRIDPAGEVLVSTHRMRGSAERWVERVQENERLRASRLVWLDKLMRKW